MQMCVSEGKQSGGEVKRRQVTKLEQERSEEEWRGVVEYVLEITFTNWRQLPS